MSLTRLLIGLSVLSTLAVVTLGYAGIALIESGDVALGAVAVLVSMATGCLPVMLSLFAQESHMYGTLS